MADTGCAALRRGAKNIWRTSRRPKVKLKHKRTYCLRFRLSQQASSRGTSWSGKRNFVFAYLLAGHQQPAVIQFHLNIVALARCRNRKRNRNELGANKNGS